MAAVERHGGAQFRVRHGCRVGDTAAITEPGDADFATGIGVFHHPLDGGEEVIHEFLRVDLFLKRTALVVVAGVAADRAQAIRGEGDEPGLGQAPRDVFDVRIEPTVFMHDHHRRRLAGGFGRAHQIGTNLAVALG
ncbi:hypothetical protein D3C76_1450370 [compost metagenome]